MAKATFGAVADRIETTWKRMPSDPHDASEAERLLEEAPEEEEEEKQQADASRVGDFLQDNLGTNGRVTRIAEGLPLVGHVVAGVQLLSGHTLEAKRALARSTKNTMVAAVATSAAIAGGTAIAGYSAALGVSSAALGLVGLVGGAMAGGAAGELAGGTSQALLEATVYNEDDRKAIGTEYLGRSPAQWGAGVAVASTVGAVGAGVGLGVDGSMLSGRLEQKLATELTETVAQRAARVVVPGLKRTSSKRRRELASLDGDGHEPRCNDAALAGGTDCSTRLAAQGEMCVDRPAAIEPRPLRRQRST